MNILEGEIKEIHTSGSLSVVKIELHDIVLSAIVIETPLTAPYLKNGNTIKVLFKETEVIIARPFSTEISIQNRIPCKIIAVVPGTLLSEVSMRFHDLEIISVITRNAYEQMKLKPGDEVIALIKTNELSLSAHD